LLQQAQSQAAKSTKPGCKEHKALLQQAQSQAAKSTKPCCNKHKAKQKKRVPEHKE
jgi:hypothetical protein